MTDSLYERERMDRDTERATSCEDRCGDWNGASTSQSMARIAGHHRILGERHGSSSPSEPLEGNNPDDTLILNF